MTSHNVWYLWFSVNWNCFEIGNDTRFINLSINSVTQLMTICSGQHGQQCISQFVFCTKTFHRQHRRRASSKPGLYLRHSEARPTEPYTLRFAGNWRSASIYWSSAVTGSISACCCHTMEPAVPALRAWKGTRMLFTFFSVAYICQLNSI